MEIHQIKYFVALCDTLNFTRAAARCNVTQPSLTRAIKLLEEELGGALFHRERANTHLTDLGRLMRPHLEQILSEIEAAKGRAQDARKLQRTTASLGMMCTIGPTKLLDLIGSYRRRYADASLVVRDGRGHDLQAMLLAGEMEIAIFGLAEPLDERLHALPLFEERFVIAIPPGHRFAAQEVVRGEELIGEASVSRANCEFHDHIAATFRERGIKTVPVYSSERDDWVMAMVQAGLGIALAPHCALTLAGLAWRPLVEPEFVRQIVIATVRGRPHSPAVGAFVREAMAWRARGCPDGGKIAA
jgi:DNA-binding transcriptional LysR family regulator